MTAQREEWVQIDNVTSFTEFILLSLRLLEKYLVVFPDISYYKQKM